MRVDFTLINPNLSISLNLADRVLGLAPSKEFSSWLNLVCLFAVYYISNNQNCIFCQLF
jgi:hypothetical protein